MKKILSFLLLTTFVLTILVPLTGVHIHKLAGALFLLFCVVHTGLRWKRMDGKRSLLLGLVLIAFLTGLFGKIFEEYPIILALHRVSSIGMVFFLAGHILVNLKSKFSRKPLPSKAKTVPQKVSFNFSPEEQ